MRRLAFLVGGVFVAFGVYELMEATSWASLRGTALWFLGGVLLHDGFAVPLTLLAGVVLARWVPGAVRDLVQGALVLSALLTLALLPLLSGRGRTAANPSQQPLPYGRNLVVVLIIVWSVAALLGVSRAFRQRRAVVRETEPAPGPIS